MLEQHALLAQKSGQEFVIGVVAQLIFQVVVSITKDLFYFGLEPVSRMRNRSTVFFKVNCIK